MGFSYLWHSKRKKLFEIRQNQKLDHAIAQKYLGVILDVDLKSDENIFVKIKKENVMLWFNYENLLYLHSPLCNTSSWMWSSNLGSVLKKHITILKNIQWHATELVDGYKIFNNTDMLKKSGWRVEGLALNVLQAEG